MILSEREQQGTLTFVQNIDSLDFACHANVRKTPIDLAQTLRSEQIFVVLRNGKREFRLTDQLKGGALYHY